MSRPTHALISISALRSNLSHARQLAGTARTWAVVKANAYGHGLAAALEAFAEADGLALLEFDKAIELRRLGWQRPILMLEGAFEPDDTVAAQAHGLSLVVHEPRQLQWLAALDALPQVDVFLKCNSGMNRLGFEPAAMHAARDSLRSAAAVGAVTPMTHLANADVAGGAEGQLDTFERVLHEVPGEPSIANSAALLSLPATRRGWVRPGVMLYGASPFADTSAAACGLSAAMQLRSQLIAVQSLIQGDAVGYGSAFVAPGPMRIGIVACGYADGYPRHAPNGTPVAVAGVRTSVVGRISMDMLAVDLGPVPQAQPGAEVELWGAQIPIDEVAAAAGTIGYELMCALAPRVPVHLVREALPTREPTRP